MRGHLLLCLVALDVLCAARVPLLPILRHQALHSPPLVFFYVVEVFLNDGRGNGSAVSTCGASYGPNATAVLLRAVGADARAAGSLWEMANAITSPP